MNTLRKLECEHCYDLGVVTYKDLNGTEHLMGCGKCGSSFDPTHQERLNLMFYRQFHHLRQTLDAMLAAKPVKRTGTHASTKKRAKSRARN